VYLITTDITSMQQRHSERVLRAAAQCGVRRARLGTWKYDLKRSPADQLKEIVPALRDITAAARELGVQVGIENHSGRDHVAAPIWDVYMMVRDLDPAHMGICFDIGHAVIEGGMSWPIQAKLMTPFFAAVYVKDFSWQKTNRGWTAAWCNLGEGMVSRAFIDYLRTTDYRGPISQHHEYALGDRAQMMAHMKRDLAVLRQWIG
jgi:sugar phosphate isomerase/epimerase